MRHHYRNRQPYTTIHDKKKPGLRSMEQQQQPADTLNNPHLDRLTSAEVINHKYRSSSNRRSREHTTNIPKGSVSFLDLSR